MWRAPIEPCACSGTGFFVCEWPWLEAGLRGESFEMDESRRCGRPGEGVILERRAATPGGPSAA